MGVGSSWGALTSMNVPNDKPKKSDAQKRREWWQAEKAAMKQSICSICQTKHAGEC